MSYTATKYFSPKAYYSPRGSDNSQRTVTLRGNLIENDTSTEYSIGGIGSTSFEVTAFSAVGLVTYSNLLGLQLRNNQRVVVYNTASNTNDGTFKVSAITPSSVSAGTFVAVPLPGKTLSGSAQTTQTAEGVGEIQFGVRQYLPQTFTATAITVSAGIATITYTTLTGPQLNPGDSVVLAGFTNAPNNGQFVILTATPTSSTAGSFTIFNAGAVATDSGTGTGNFTTGSGIASTAKSPIQLKVDSSKGWVYRYDYTNHTIRIFVTGTSANTILNEAALGASVAFDGTATFEAVFIRNYFK